MAGEEGRRKKKPPRLATLFETPEGFTRGTLSKVTKVNSWHGCDRAVVRRGWGLHGIRWQAARDSQGRRGGPTSLHRWLSFARLLLLPSSLLLSSLELSDTTIYEP